LGADGPFEALLDQVDRAFAQERLWVRPDVLKSGQGFGDIVATVMGCLRVKRFTESRFCSVGPAARAFVLSCLVGLPSLVAETRSDPNVVDFYLSKWDQHFSDKMLRFAIVAGLASWVPEAVLNLTFNDDRLARQAAEVRQAAEEEVRFLVDLPKGVGQRLAGLVKEGDYSELREQTLMCAHVAFGYLEHRIFSVLAAPHGHCAQGTWPATWRLSCVTRSRATCRTILRGRSSAYWAQASPC